MLERHARTPAAVGARRGRALVSFTNIATAQLRGGCHDRNRADLVAFPHFIGTIDQFFWRFLVQPFHRGLHRLESWADLGMKAQVTLDRSVDLTDFAFRRAVVARQCTAELLQGHRAKMAIAGSNFAPEQFAEAAVRLRDSLMAEGYVTGHEVRVLAARTLASKPWVSQRLATRFYELVVDEAQDCSVMDLQLLESLAAAGLPLMLIGDPDQGIYEWRDAEPGFLRRLSKQWPSYLLTGNWRSSATICKLAATLRSGGPERPPDVAVAAGDDWPSSVLLIPYGRGGPPPGDGGQHASDVAAAMELFAGVASHHNVPVQDCLVVAHWSADLPSSSSPGQRTPNRSTLERLARSAATFADATASAAQRRRALGVAEQVLCRRWWSETDQLGVAALCRTGLITAESLRRRAAVFLSQLPPVGQAQTDHWYRGANNTLKAQMLPPGATPSHGRGLLKLRKDEKAKLLCELVGTSQQTKNGTDGDEPTFSVIHQVKGAQAPGVLLALPSKQPRATELLEAWAHADPAAEELLRILYVAVTRAQRLVALTYPAAVHEAVRILLAGRSVPYTVVCADYGTGLF